jgi:hypothetical protein
MTRPARPSDTEFERTYRRWMLMHGLTLPLSQARCTRLCWSRCTPWASRCAPRS